MVYGHRAIPYEMTLRRQKRLPAAAAPPQLGLRLTKELGTADADATAIAQRAMFSADELRAKAVAARQRREEAGVADSIERMQPHEYYLDFLERTYGPAPAFEVEWEEGAGGASAER